MYVVLSCKLVDFTDQTSGRQVKGHSIYVRPVENNSPHVVFGIEPIKIFLPESVALPVFKDGALYELRYDLFGSKPRVIGIVEAK